MGFLQNLQESAEDTWNQVKDVFQQKRQQKREITQQTYRGKRYDQVSGTYPQSTAALQDDIFGDDRGSSYTLRERFIDYENMDDYAEISAALDKYASEATKPDMMTDKRIWADSKNKNVSSDLNYLLQEQLAVEKDIWGEVRYFSKYGNHYLHMLIGDGGVIDKEPLPAALTRRVNDEMGQLMGFVVSETTTDSTGINADQFRKKVKDRYEESPDSEYWASEPFKSYEARSDEQVFLDFEVSHFRLRGQKSLMSEYGYSAVENARGEFKRLSMMEDAAVVYKLCLRGDSKVWTTDGYKKIKDIEKGDSVYCFGKDRELRETTVNYKDHNGTDDIYRVKSKHRDLHANATHPVLCRIVEHNGSGNPKTYRYEYVEVQDIEPGKHHFVTPNVEEESGEDIELKMPEERSKSWIKPEYVSKVNRNLEYREINQECGVSHAVAKPFLEGEKKLKTSTAISLINRNGQDPDKVLEHERYWGGVDSVNLPDKVTPDFARWFGFMLGDGFITNRQNASNTGYVGFAIGDDEQVNQYYKDLFEKFFGDVQKRSDTGYRLGNYGFYSKELTKFMEANGYVPGAHDKRIPDWVFRAKKHIQWEFLQGLFDADAHYQPDRIRTNGCRDRIARWTLEMCNKELVEDVRVLSMQLGMRVTRVRHRKRDSRVMEYDGHRISETESWAVEVSRKTQPISQEIKSVEKVGEDDIWDIGVEDEVHNFVADGVVVHNTRAPSRHIFYVDVGKMDGKEAMQHVEQAKNKYRKHKYVDEETGNLDFSYNPLAQDEDIWLPAGEDGNNIEAQQMKGSNYQSVEDLKHFQYKVGLALAYPELMDKKVDASKPLDHQNITFASKIMRIQRDFLEGYKKVCAVHLWATGRDPRDFVWDLHMTVPSAILELARVEVMSAKTDIMRNLKKDVSVRWMLAELFGFSEEEATQLMVMRQDEKDWAKASDTYGQVQRDVLRDVVQNQVQDRMSDDDDDGGGGMGFGASQEYDKDQLIEHVSDVTDRKEDIGAYGINGKQFQQGEEDMSRQEMLDQIQEQDHMLMERLNRVYSLIENIRRTGQL